MFDKKDQQELSKVYTSIIENSISPGKPVIVTMDLPGAVPEIVHDETQNHTQEHDPSEIQMALSEIHKIAEYLPDLKELVGSTTSLEGWVASKITKAADYISSVYHWLSYESSEGDCGCSDRMSSMFEMGYEDTGCEYASQGCKCGECEDCH